MARLIALALMGIVAVASMTFLVLNAVIKPHQTTDSFTEPGMPVVQPHPLYSSFEPVTASPPVKPVPTITVKYKHHHKPLIKSVAVPVKQVTVSPSVITPTQTPTPSPTPTPKLNLYGAAKAVAFAVAQLGCPYVYGGTGPCDAGYDCSGLVQAAWSFAGVSIPRTSYDQWNLLQHVSLSDLQLGDIIVSNGAGHVAIYVGDGYLIDALNQGTPVEKISMSTSWYAASIIGAVRP